MNALMTDFTRTTVNTPGAAAMRIRGLSIEVDRPDAGPGSSTQLVRDVSFDVRSGEMVGLAGESGSGKSLTAAAVADLLPTGVRRSDGEIHVMNEPVGSGEGGHAQKAAMIFQNPMTSLNPSMRIGDQIAEAARLRNPGMSRSAARRRAVEVLESVEVDRAAERARQFPYEFSGGMRQRAMIGIAIALEPAVLIADEPTTALDVTVQEGVMSLIDRLRKELGLAVLLISHDLGVINERCDRLLVMYGGQLVEQGGTRELLGLPLHPYLEGLIRCIPERAMELGRLEPLRGQVPPPYKEFPGCRFADRCDWVTPDCREGVIPLISTDSERDVRCIRWNERLVNASNKEVSPS